MLSSAPLPTTPTIHDISDLLRYVERECMGVGEVGLVNEGSTYAWANERGLVVDSSLGGKTIVLPRTIGPVMQVVIQRTANGTHPVTIVPDPGCTLDGGVAAIQVPAPGDAISVWSFDGFNWWTHRQTPRTTQFSPAPFLLFPRTETPLPPASGRAITVADISPPQVADPLTQTFIRL